MICEHASFRKKTRFEDLIESVQHCNLCSRLCSRRKVLSKANGNIESKVLFIAEAPGRLGADKTGIPLYGDRTGYNFETLIGNISWRREQIFISNAILCNPQDDDGTNGTPTPDEVANCSAYLEMVITLVNPEVIVTLGTTALDAVAIISPHSMILRDSVATFIPWNGKILFPLYHPGPRATVHRSLAKQRADFMILAKTVNPLQGILTRQKHPTTKKISLFPAGLSPIQQVARSLLELCCRMTYFKLTKLLYLVDLTAIERLGKMIAGDVYLRQVDGPWLPKLDQVLADMDGFEIRRFFIRRIPMVALGPSPRTEVQLDDDILQIILEVYRTYGHMSNSEIKTSVYKTKPMRFILQQERIGIDMRNKAILYKNKTIMDDK